MHCDEGEQGLVRVVEYEALIRLSPVSELWSVKCHDFQEYVSDDGRSAGTTELGYSRVCYQLIVSQYLKQNSADAHAWELIL